mmetsp:Transcript_58573/g.156795  ORF Transcript_58573/g.156795 Transcript_58573/m.156795 type:complete len:194 (-) Transcript_58573:120-701(-)
MIRGVADAELEMKVMEREGRFIAGLEWQLRDTLRQLEAEERALAASLAAPAVAQPLPLECETPAGCRSSDLRAEASQLGRRSPPRTPPLQALLALDPLCASAMPPLQLDSKRPGEDGKRKASSPLEGFGAVPCKLLKGEAGAVGKAPSEDSTTEGASDCDGFTSSLSSFRSGKAPSRWHCGMSSSSDALTGSP